MALIQFAQPSTTTSGGGSGSGAAMVRVAEFFATESSSSQVVNYPSIVGATLVQVFFDGLLMPTTNTASRYVIIDTNNGDITLPPKGAELIQIFKQS